jgi:hypothetical protein
MFASNAERAVAGWQNASQSEQNARGPQWTCEPVALKIRSEGEREHVARSTRHFAGLFRKHKGGK